MEVEKGISSPLILPEAWADLTDWVFGASDGKGSSLRWAYFANWNAAEPSNFRPFSALSARRKLEICWKWNWGFPETEKRKKVLFPLDLYLSIGPQIAFFPFLLCRQNPEVCDLVVNKYFSVIAGIISFWVPATVMVWVYVKVKKRQISSLVQQTSNQTD